MSINLCLKDGLTGERIDLRQTPTFITNMCLSYNRKGKPDGGQLAVRRRYLMWVASYTDGVWEDHQDLEDAREFRDDHINIVLKVKKPKFYSI